MKADARAFMDACVLANFGVCDLLLRLAEKPRLFLPFWSNEVLDEVYRVHVQKLHWKKEIADSFQSEIRRAFPEATVEEYEHLTPDLTNDKKDRHVLAAAIRSGSSLILTFNVKDFPKKSLKPWSIDVSHPQDFLLNLYEMESAQVVIRIAAIAARRKLEPLEVLRRLGKVLPKFSSKLIEDLNLR